MRPGSIWIALVLVGVGVCGFLDATGVVDASRTIGEWWPLAVIAWPLAEMVSALRVTLGGVIWSAIGLALLADEQQWTSGVAVWSALAVFIGLAILANGVVRRSEEHGGNSDCATQGGAS